MVKQAWMLASPALQAYYETEWGQPEHDDQRLFELLCLETYQAGLSWQTVLAKRAAFAQAFHQFNIELVAQMTPAEIELLLQNPAIIRNRRKLEATVYNAQRVLSIQQTVGSFDRYLWQFVDFKPIVNRPTSWAVVPAKSPLSEKLAKDMRRRGFKFVGPVICYSFLQGAGLIDDHLATE